MGAPPQRYYRLAVLGTDDAAKLSALADLCATADGERAELYRDAETPGTYPAHHLLAGADGALLGYLGLFAFELAGAEMVGLVRPDARRRGHFRALFTEACATARGLGASRVTLVVPGASGAGRSFAERVGGTLDETEHHMACTRPAAAPRRPELALRPAGPDDADLLARLDAASFDSSFDVMRARFADILGDPRRRAWVLVRGQQALGKLHARSDGRAASIHDLCIAPEARRQGLGRFMVATAAEELHAAGFSPLGLDVAASHRDATRLYEACGFRIESTLEYWAVEL